MLRRLLLPAFLALSLAQALPAAAQQSAAEMAPAERAAVEEVVREYLLAHPELIVEAIQTLEQRERAAADLRQQQALAQSMSELQDDVNAPVLGDPEGDVVVVEFFDYQCGYCKSVAAGLQQEVAADGDIKLVMKEFPILGAASVTAAKAALAAGRQGKYEAFHWAMMEHKGGLDEATVMAVAGQVGLNLERLKADMADPEIEELLAANYALAEKLDIRGTPAFVIGDRLVPGALSMSQFRQLVEQARRS